ncbi:MAG: leucine-rich repeat domain-containing protein [Salinivirgaceae bacterium]|nr:leucine-rich repeat domain-containing protein [Salinivirgaceae bacterium]
MKRIFTILFAAMLAGQTWATDYDFKIDNVCYSTWFGDAYVECENSSDDYANNYSGLTTVTIPDTIEYDGDKYPVIGISRSAFKNCSSLTSITLPNTIHNIREYAFEGCSSLESVVIPSSVTSLGENVFCNCTSLTSVTLPDTITYISAAAFGNCSSLTSIEIPNTVTFIGNSAFSGSGLTSIEIPNSVTEIASFAFKECDGLETITIPATVEKVQSWVFQGCDNLTVNCCATSIPTGWSTYWNDYNIPYNLGSCGGMSDPITINFNYYFSSDTTVAIDKSDDYKDLTEVVIPDNVEINGKKYAVTSISFSAFENCVDLTSVTIPNTVEIILASAFYGCTNLTSINIPKSVTNIGHSTFCGCSSLKSLTLPNSITNIGYNAFLDCSNLTSINIPEGVTTIEEATFYGCSSLTSVSIPESLTSIGRCAFYYCENLTSINIPESVTYIGEYAFQGCENITSITIPDGVTSIGDGTFSGCKKLTFIYIPESVTTIGEYAFQGCDNITSITIPDGVTTIGEEAFEDCDNLTTITIPQSVTHIGNSAFNRCGNLTIYCEAESQPIGWDEDWNYNYWNYNYKVIPVIWNAGSNLRIFKVNATANNSAYGSVEGVVAVVNGYTTTITVRPANGYHFTSWNDNNTDNPRTLTVTSDTSLTAFFEAHTVVSDSAVAATCTEKGQTEGSHCSVCGKVIVAQKTISALGHEFVNYIYNNDATTTADGTETAVCEHGCGETDTRVKEGTKLATTAVTESAANAVNIYAAGNKIVIENATDEIFVYNAMGVLVGRDVARNVSTIKVNNPGVYIVKTGSTVKRVVVN